MTLTRPLAIGTLLAAAIACSGDPTAVGRRVPRASIIDRFTGNMLGK